MTKNKKTITQTNYRKQLIQLAKLYGIVEIKNYFKSAKRLTTTQIELLLIKNKIKLPSRKILSKFYLPKLFNKTYLRQFYYTLVATIVVVGFFGGAPHLIKFFHKVDRDLWEQKGEIAKHKNDSIDQILKESELKFNQDDEIEREMEITHEESKQEKGQNTISLNASTISSLFDDHDYNLSDIRKGKKVKPFHISLLPKDLYLIEDAKERKNLFIKIVLPLILQENKKITEDRKKLFKILNKKFNSKTEARWLKWKFKQYKVDNSDISELKMRMDIIPVSLAIAQAAIESGWGTSRFAIEGNALFGQWTWSNKGLEPENKDDGKSHKIMQFKILTASVRAYKKNLNTHSGYKEFREARTKLRIEGKELNGLELTKYLHNYAETGKKYTRIIELTINKNSLTDFDGAKLLSIGVRKGIAL